MPQPEFCPDEIYKIMVECWQYQARMRPKFQFLSRFFINILKTPEPVEEDESQEIDENEKQHSNTVYV